MKKYSVGLFAGLLVFGVMIMGCGQQTGELPEILVVTDRSPDSGASGIDFRQTLSLTFKFQIEIDDLTVSDFFASFGNDHTAGTPEISSAKLEWSADHKTVTISGITGWSNLAGSVGPKTVDVRAAAGKIRDVFDNELRAGHLLWNFDLAGIIASVSPESGAADVPIDAQIKAVFSDSMDASTIDSSTFKLAGSSVPGTVNYNAATKTATFTPSQTLQYNHTYVATLGADIKDSLGDRMGKDYSWSFTTEDIAGVLDPSFGANGVAVYRNTNGNDFGFSILTDSAGRILISATLWNGTDMDLAVLRYDSDGNLDTSFGSGGVARYDSGGNDIGYGMVLDSSGRILVTGSIWNGANGDLGVVRFSTNGSLDTSFGTSGLAKYDGGTEDRAFNLILDSSGRILACGMSANATDFDMVVARFDNSGNLDAGFGTAGVARYNGGGSDIGHSILIDESGRILVSGSIWSGSDSDLGIVRFDASGNLDTSFGVSGVALYSTSGEDVGHRMAFDSSGNILVTGGVWNGTDRDMAILRFNSNGGLDTSFGNNGIVLYDGGHDLDRGIGLLIDTQNRILVSGYANNGTDLDLFVWRYSSNGSPDTTFGTNGILAYDGGYGEDKGYGISTDSLGRVLVTGYSSTESDWDITSLRIN